MVVLFQSLCRRFCACLVLLRSLHTCTLDTEYYGYHESYQLSLGFVFRLFLLANDIFEEVFQEIRTCCKAERHATQTPKLMSTLALYLGQMLAEVSHLRRYAQSSPRVSATPNLVARS